MASSSLSKGGSHGNNGWAPYDIGIMLIDEDPTSLLFIHTLLRTCHYRVVSFEDPVEALCALCKRIGEFDLVIADLHMVNMPGFNLVERIAKGMRLPIITTCADEDSQLLHQALDCGACFHLVKPITINGMEFVWKKSWQGKVKGPIGPPRVMNFASDNKKTITSHKGDRISIGKRHLQIVSSSCTKVARDGSNSTKKKDDIREKDEDSDPEEKSRTRLQWDSELHTRFLVALALLGDDAVPTSIIGIMNVAGLTTKQVASHLQKHRKRMHKEKLLKAKAKKSSSKQITARKLSTNLAPVYSKRAIHTLLDNQNYQEQCPKPGAGKTPLILPKPPASSQVTGSSLANFSTVRNGPLILLKPSTTKKRAPFPQNQKSRLEFDERKGLFTYQPFLLKPSVTDQFTINTYGSGISPTENNTGSSENYNAPLPGNIVDPLPFSNPFNCIFNSTASSSTLQSNNVGSDAMNSTMKEPAYDAVSEWPGLDEFLGLDGSLQVSHQKDRMDAGIGSSTMKDFNFGFGCDFNNFGDLTFDDKFLAEFLDDIDKGGVA